MADDTAKAEESPITFHVKSSSDAKYTLSLSPSTTVLDLKNKLASSDYADIPAERQRLIYSGRVLKDGDTLAAHKVKDGHTIHLVKSAASNQQQQTAASQPASSASEGTSTSASQGIPNIPSNLATGTGNNPLAGLTGARYAGFAQLPGAGMFGPDGGMGPPPDPEQMISMLENPQFQSTINEALQNPQLIDMMIQQNPMLRDMGPGVRQFMQTPAFRRMLTDPNSIRQMTQMQRAMGLGDLGQPGGDSAFPAPGVTNTTPEESRGTQDTTQGNTTNTTQPPPNPFAALGNQGGAANPFAALFGANPPFGSNPAGAGGGQTQGQGGADNQNAPNPPNPFGSMFNPPGANPSQQGTADANSNAQPGADIFANLRQNNPFLQDPALLAQVMQGIGAPGAAPTDGSQNPSGGLFPQMGGGGFGAPQPPADNRPPEERYAEQLRQLNDMGFHEFERNIEALRRAGGSVQGAVEYLLTH